jgi:predicted peptidase
MKKWLLTVFLFIYGMAQAQDTHFKTSSTYSYYLESFGKSTAGRPVIIFLHGSFERGSDLNLVLAHGPLKNKDFVRNLPFVIVAPQCNRGDWWSADTLVKFINEVVAATNVDKKAIFITGLSMGGFATWDLAIKYPEMFAAAVPICGGGDSLNVCNARRLPIWAFHGAKDPIVNVRKSRNLVNRLKACGGNIRYTEYPDAGHDSWTATYENTELYQWFNTLYRKKHR